MDPTHRVLGLAIELLEAELAEPDLVLLVLGLCSFCDSKIPLVH